MVRDIYKKLIQGFIISLVFGIVMLAFVLLQFVPYGTDILGWAVIIAAIPLLYYLRWALLGVGIIIGLLALGALILWGLSTMTVTSWIVLLLVLIFLKLNAIDNKLR